MLIEQDVLRGRPGEPRTGISRAEKARVFMKFQSDAVIHE
ncbi:hypothetical protein FACS1894216_19150 [Synergistales bacterium]|nr:hypothetical protein FACS1894216_19150 [Synergistales bacterium]